MLRTRSSIGRRIDSRIVLSAVAELDGASPVSTGNRLGQAAELRSVDSRGRLSLREHCCTSI
jgi:hypothetical protein